MPLVYDDVPGSWGVQSKGWPSTRENAYDKYVFLNKLKKEISPVPYGSYVYADSSLRVETTELMERLEAEYKAAGSPSRNETMDRYYKALAKDKSSVWPSLDKWW